MSKGKINHIFSSSLALWMSMNCDVSLNKCVQQTIPKWKFEEEKTNKYEGWLKRKSCVYIDVAGLFFIIFIFIIFALFLLNLESNGRNKPFNHWCDAVVLLLLCLGHQTVRGELNSFKCLLSRLSSFLCVFFLYLGVELKLGFSSWIKESKGDFWDGQMDNIFTIHIVRYLM